MHNYSVRSELMLSTLGFNIENINDFFHTNKKQRVINTFTERETSNTVFLRT